MKLGQKIYVVVLITLLGIFAYYMYNKDSTRYFYVNYHAFLTECDADKTCQGYVTEIEGSVGVSSTDGRFFNASELMDTLRAIDNCLKHYQAIQIVNFHEFASKMEYDDFYRGYSKRKLDSISRHNIEFVKPSSLTMGAVITK